MRKVEKALNFLTQYYSIDTRLYEYKVLKEAIDKYENIREENKDFKNKFKKLNEFLNTDEEISIVDIVKIQLLFTKEPEKAKKERRNKK